MGSASRMSRCERFITEFGDDAIKKADIPLGVVTRVWLDSHDCFEMVFLYVELKFPSGEYVFMDPENLYDPENMDDEDLIERIAENYCHGDLKLAEQRLEKADLL